MRGSSALVPPLQHCTGGHASPVIYRGRRTPLPAVVQESWRHGGRGLRVAGNNECRGAAVLCHSFGGRVAGVHSLCVRCGTLNLGDRMADCCIRDVGLGLIRWEACPPPPVGLSERCAMSWAQDQCRIRCVRRHCPSNDLRTPPPPLQSPPHRGGGGAERLLGPKSIENTRR